VHKALVAWEKKRNANAGFKYGHGSGGFRREKADTATRDEISWNSAPEVKRVSDSAKVKAMAEAKRAEARQRMRHLRAQETPEEKAVRLEARRAARGSVSGRTYKQRPKMTPDERKASVKAARARYQKRVRLGLVTKTVRKPSKLTAEQLKAKAARGRKYYEQNKRDHRAAISVA
jgi:hypothetical protein